MICLFSMLFLGKSCASCALQTHADYEHRLQEEVNARLLKEQELQQLVTQLPNFTHMALTVIHIVAAYSEHCFPRT